MALIDSVVPVELEALERTVPEEVVMVDQVDMAVDWAVLATAVESETVWVDMAVDQED